MRNSYEPQGRFCAWSVAYCLCFLSLSERERVPRTLEETAYGNRIAAV